MGVAADMATLPENLSERQREDEATMLVASVMNDLASKTWLSGVSSLTAGLADPERNAQNWLERTMSAFATPAVMGGVARQIDPVVRQREGVRRGYPIACARYEPRATSCPQRVR